MKNIIYILAMVIAGLLLYKIIPWWFDVAIVGLGGGLLLAKERTLASICLIGFLAGALLWGGYAGWINMGNEGILAGRLGKALGGLGGTSVVLLTGLFGGLLSVAGSWLGYSLRNLPFFSHKPARDQ